MRRHARPEIDVGKSVRIARTYSAFIVMREKLGFVAGNIDADRAIALAALAGKAEIERLLHFFAAPAIANDFPSRHLPQKMSATAGRVFFFMRGPVAGTHQAAFFAPALAHPHTAQSGLGKAAVVIEKLKVGFRFPGRIAGTESKIFVELVRLDQFARIHLPIRIPCRLELTESLDEFRSKHLRKQFGARLAVAVFAGERTAVADDKIGGLFHKLSEPGDAVFRLQIEVQSRVDAAVAEVSVERALVVETLHQAAEIAKICAEFFGSHGRVLPAFPVGRLSGDVRGCAQR